MSLTREPELLPVDGPEMSGPARLRLASPPPPPQTRRRAPLRRWSRRAVLSDTLAAAVASLLALVARFGLDSGNEIAVYYGALGVLITVAWPLLLAISGAYELRSSLFGVEEIRRIMRAGLLLVASAGMAHIVFRLSLSRGYFIILLPSLLALTTVMRTAVQSLATRARDSVRDHRVVAVGPCADIEQFCAELVRTHTRSQVEVVAYVADDLDPQEPAPPSLAHLRRLTSRSDVRSLAEHGLEADLLVRAGRPGSDEMTFLGLLAHDLGLAVAIAPHRKDAAASVAVSYVPLGSTPMLMVETPTLRPAAAVVKVVFDRLMALVMLIVLAPVFALIAATIAIRDGRPVFFRQERVGRYGQRFQCWKFRTMCPDAESRLDELRDENEAGGLLFKLRDDPRVTKTGRVLRRHSLDELPQLFHVLTGEMSIVGPRPPLPCEVEQYDARTSRRLHVKPGLTGLWQTQGRSDLPWDDGIYLDLMYVDHWSPLLDLVIMARTVRTVLRPAGAY